LEFVKVVRGHVEVGQQNYIYIYAKKSPVHTPNEPYKHDKRALFEYHGKFEQAVVGLYEICQQHHTYIRKKRALCIRQKCPTNMPKEPYLSTMGNSRM